MVLTRSHHFDHAVALPDASWALFFMAGVVALPFSQVALLMVLAILIDAFTVTLGSVSSACFSAAYPFLIAAYGLLWLMGRIARPWLVAGTLKLLSMAVLWAAVAVALTYSITNASFYGLSGLFEALSWSHFSAQFWYYWPDYFYINMTYMLVALLIYRVSRSLTTHTDTANSSLL
ncbi:MAG: hypothetical protein RQ715_05410 [Methylococcales bacterium]|nr:hypothetical protein [Methylococcales bacterium]